MSFRPPARLEGNERGKKARMTEHLMARSRTTIVLLAGAVAAWAVSVVRMRGMDAGPGTDIGGLGWYLGGPYAAGGVIVAAGLYELTPLKRLTLRRCRSAPHESAFRGGLAHGLDCVGCSGALMAVLFVLGAMSLVWMAVVAVAIFAEKVLPRGPRLAPVIAVAVVALGIWVAVSPASVPGLTEPGQSPSMEMGS